VLTHSNPAFIDKFIHFLQQESKNAQSTGQMIMAILISFVQVWGIV
jgi:hypothetical protein